MLTLVGPESVTTSCLCSSRCGPSHELLQARSSPGQCSRVRFSRSGAGGGKKVQRLAGTGSRSNVRFIDRGGVRLCAGPSPTSDSRQASRSQVCNAEDAVEAASTSGSKEAGSEDEEKSASGGEWRAAAVGAAIAGALFFVSPSVDVTDLVVTFSANSAVAASIPLGQMRPGTMFLDKLVGGFKSSRVIDKVVTVVSGQVVVNPEELEKELKEILEGPDSFEKWRNGLLDNVQDGIGTAFDVISHLTPESVQESMSTSITGLFEAGAERFAAFELSALVGLTERWLIYIPLVVLPMAWQMQSRSNARAEDARAREERRLVLSEENEAKAQRVRRELERIRLKASLLEIIKSIGETALQPPRNGPQMKGKEIEDVVEFLKVLNPGYEVQLNLSDPGSTMRSGGANDAFTDTPAAPELDGDWSLVYVSQSIQNGDVSRIPGFEIHNPRQQVWQQGSTGTTTAPSLDADTLGSSLLVAKNVAELRLGPLGVVEIAVQGSWEMLRNGQAGLVSFDTFLARPKEILGTRFFDDLPPVSVPLPRALQQTAEWEVLYLDETMRINRGRQGQLFIFTKKK